MNLFYCKDITPNAFCTLDIEESRHAVRVLRLREGDEIHVTDGKGNLYTCRIIDANDKACSLTPLPLSAAERGVDTSDFPHPSPCEEGLGVRLHLAVAPTKNPSRMEWLVEKAVEIGVGEITLLDCDHSERSFLKTDRLEKLAISAMKQSLHTVLPEIHPAVNLKDWLNSQFSVLNSQLKFIAHCEADKPRTPLATALQPGHDVVVLIGPEGDFSEEEIALALDCGFQPVSLGPSRLRTETAALYAVTAFNLINDR
ncbi:MAG: 16S rRNA (uracil(1498)-N(3))-methyltransferase [Bacteroidales bacterium]|nr:16S rRNA (uracil(1498)-N(3))-methyltransferase [Bacteroidales bacterium]